MQLPKGNPVWLNLRKSFIDIGQLLFFLKQQEFTGCLHSVYKETQGLIFLDEGDAVAGIKETGGHKKSGHQIVIDIQKEIRNELDCLVSVYQLSPAAISFFSYVFSRSITGIHRELSSEFTNLGKFIEKILKDKKSGYMEIRLIKKSQKIFVLLEAGEIRGLVSDFFEIGIENKTVTEKKLIDVFIQKAYKMRAIYDYFALP